MLTRYSELVGQRLLQIMIEQSNLSIEPWQWKVKLEGTSLWDQHFFPSMDAAVKAYRVLLMNIGKQSSLIIGNGLSQRLASETYNQLSQAKKRDPGKPKIDPSGLWYKGNYVRNGDYACS